MRVNFELHETVRENRHFFGKRVQSTEDGTYGTIIRVNNGLFTIVWDNGGRPIEMVDEFEPHQFKILTESQVNYSLFT